MNMLLLLLTVLLSCSVVIVLILYLHLLPYTWLRTAIKWLFITLYKVKLIGLDNYQAAGERVVIVANHSSLLDVLLLSAFLPDKFLFALNPLIAKQWWMQPFLPLVKVFILDTNNALAAKPLIKAIRQNQKCVIFPEGRITTTGALMKIYEGPGIIADKADAVLLPIHIQGAQYTFFSRLAGKLKLRLLPTITLTILPPHKLVISKSTQGRARREIIGRQLYDLMSDMVFKSSRYQTTLFQSLLNARSIHTDQKLIIEDIERAPLSYRQLIARSFLIGEQLASTTRAGEAVGILLPNSIATLVTFFALQAYGRVAVMLNPTAGSAQLISACQIAQVRQLITAEHFIAVTQTANFADTLIEHGITFIYLDALRNKITWHSKLRSWARSFYANTYYRQISPKIRPQDPAVILFTAGSEGTPKGVVLSHQNIEANRYQIMARLTFTPQDSVFNAMPMFHAFGLTVATLIPIFAGIKTFLYPSPLHYRSVPELIYDTSATITFGTDTFLAHYAQYAHPYDFYNLRFVFAGAEKLRETTQKLWMEKFGVRILEGYGTTETAPVIAMNTLMQNKMGSVGRLLPGLAYRLEPVAGITTGGKLLVSGPNIMLGYLLAGQPRQLIAPTQGWHDTGDVVTIDAQGYLFLIDRLKRFAKLGGEMVSLTALEQQAATLWPQHKHAALTITDAQQGEKIILISNNATANREKFIQFCKQANLSRLYVPAQLVFLAEIPVLASGKNDYVKLQQWLETQPRNVTI